VTFEHDQYYDCRIIGVRHVEVGKSGTKALEFAVRFANGTQDSLYKFLTEKTMFYTRETLEGLGCNPDDLTGADWLRKINAKLSEKQASVHAKEEGKYGVKLAGIYPRRDRVPPKELVNAPSPFGAERKRDEFDTGMPEITDGDVPF
jgi:hypothetical protein